MQEITSQLLRVVVAAPNQALQYLIQIENMDPNCSDPCFLVLDLSGALVDHLPCSDAVIRDAAMATIGAA